MTNAITASTLEFDMPRISLWTIDNRLAPVFEPKHFVQQSNYPYGVFFHV